MREERVTINILNWLESNKWEIVCYDFPQSGTGLLIHPNSKENRTSKNKKGIIPDIIAVKEKQAVFFENKDRYVQSDFEKVREIKIENNYSEGLNNLLETQKITNIYFGIGIPNQKKEIKKCLENLKDIDFLISTNEENHVFVDYDKYNVFYRT